MSQVAFPLHSHDPESGGFQEEPRDWENLVKQDQSTELSPVTESGSYKHEPGNESLSSLDSTMRDRGRHWWQMRIISNYTLSEFKGPNSDV